MSTRPRITPKQARDFAAEVHTADYPVLFRTYPDRATANSRCWEWNHTRPVFEGLGIEFEVRQTPGPDPEFGIYATPAEDADHMIVHTPDFGPLLRLTPLQGATLGEGSFFVGRKA